MASEKRTNPVKTFLGDTDYIAFSRLCALDGRSESDYLRFLLLRHMYGMVPTVSPDGKWSSSAYSDLGGPERD